MDWDQLKSKPCQEKQDDTSSVSSVCLTGSSANSSISDNEHHSSAAVEALVIASLIPTRQVNREFDDMPAITLNGRRTDTEAVMTKDIAEMVRI
jgi:hypothetical protein